MLRFMLLIQLPLNSETFNVICGNVPSLLFGIYLPSLQSNISYDYVVIADEVADFQA